MRSSVELDKRDSLRDSFIKAIKDFKPNYPLLFDKNLKERSTKSKYEKQEYNSKLAKSNDCKNCSRSKYEIKYEGPTISDNQTVEVHDFRNTKVTTKMTKVDIRDDLDDLLNDSDDFSSSYHPTLKKKKRKTKKKKRIKRKFRDESFKRLSQDSKAVTTRNDLTEETINPLHHDSILVFENDNQGTKFDGTDTIAQPKDDPNPHPSRVDELLDEILSDQDE